MMTNLVNITLEKFNEYIVQKSKVDLIKTNSNILSKLYHINIHIGNLAKNRNNNLQINSDSQLVYLLGEESNVNKARKYLDALCNPVQTQKIPIKEKALLKKIEDEEFRNDLIKKHCVHLILTKENVLLIQGTLEDVFDVKYLIDMEETKLTTNQKISTSKYSLEEKMDDDDDIIWIDPSQIFDDKKNPHKSSKISLNDEMDVESSLERFNFIQTNIKTIDNANIISNFTPDTSILNKIKKDKNDKSQASSLNEYATMFEKQEFNRQEEKLNKVKRIEKLISAMPNDQKAIALNQVKAHSTRNMQKSINRNDYSPDNILEEDKIKCDEPSLIIIDESDDDDHSKTNKNNNKTKHITFSNSRSAPKMENLVISNSLEQNDNTIVKIASDSNFININSNKTNVHQNRQRAKEMKPINLREMRSKSSNNSRTNSFNNNLANKNNKFKNRDDLNQILNDNSNMVRNNQFFSNNNLVEQIPGTSSLNSNNNTVGNNSLRFIIIDGSNVAREHGTNYGKAFSCKGIKIVVDYFLKRGHTDIKALVPRFRRGQSDTDCPTRDPEILDQLEKDGYLTYTPSRYVNNKLICPYDDRFILKAAQHYNAIIVSNDNYRDLMSENYEWKKLVEKNLLQYTFIGDLFMIADDPFGRRGPNIDEFLSGKTTKNNNFNNNNMKKSNQASAPQTSIINFTNVKNHTMNTNNNQRNHQQPQQNKQQYQRPHQHQQQNQSRARSLEKHNYILSQLKSIFPNYLNEINDLLKKYPYEQDVNFFASELLKFNK